MHHVLYTNGPGLKQLPQDALIFYHLYRVNYLTIKNDNDLKISDIIEGKPDVPDKRYSTK